MLQKLSDEKRGAVSTHKLRCPGCGLWLEVSGCSGQATIGYDLAAWDRLCTAPKLGGPSVCLMLQDRAVARAGRHHDD